MKTPGHRLPNTDYRLSSSAHRPPSSHLPTFAPSQIRNPKSKIQNLPFPLHLHLHLNPNPLPPPAFHFPPSTNAASSTPSPLNPLTPSRPPAGFSLTEVVIALGIFAVAMVGVLALFPVASATGRESSEENQAAILAQTILCDLRASTRARGAANGWLIRGPDTFNTANWSSPDLTASGTFRQAYDLRRRTDGDGAGGVGMVGNPIALKAMTNTVNATVFSNGLTIAGAIYLAQTTLRPVTGQPGLAQVEILVQTPANQPQTNRRSFLFNSLVYAR